MSDGQYTTMETSQDGVATIQ